ncbi:MAG TPA: hypothetical protein VK995_05580, partial [Oceanipulchritudo sp.]|nr:hypothetical protein [Oceanipulchritudo sp.]
MMRLLYRNSPWLWLAGMLAMGARLIASADSPLVTGDWVRVVGEGAGVTLQLNGSAGAGSLLFDLRESPMDLSGNTHISVVLANGTMAHLDARVIVANEALASERHAECRFFVKGGETEAMQVFLMRPYFPEDHHWRKAFGRIRGLPGGYQGIWSYLDLAAIGKVQVMVRWQGIDPGTDRITLSLPHGVGEYLTDNILPDDLPHPLLDRMGQLRGETWEGKVVDEAELAADGMRDFARYADHPVRDGLTQYGGWKDGPRLEASGHFRTKKIDGKWWLVDPEGYLFWSLGVTGAGGGATTQIKGREEFFPDLSIEPLWGTGADKRVYDFMAANQFRKYGEDWETANAAVTLGRMRAWGLNTIGAWS